MPISPVVTKKGMLRCKICGCLWTEWSDGTCSLAPGAECQPRCAGPQECWDVEVVYDSDEPDIISQEK